MPYNTRELLKDAKGQPTPNYYNPNTDKYEVLEGVHGGPFYTHRGTVAMESWEGSTTITKTFDDERYGFAIMNDGIADLTFTIHGNIRTVKPGEGYSALFEPFTSLSINAASSYRAEVLK